MDKQQIPYNTDKEGCASCIKAGYYKMGRANFIGHTNDGLKATCIIETMDKRLVKLLESGIEITDTCMLDTYNQQVQSETSCTIRTNINTANHHFIMEKEPKIISYSRSREDGSIINRHLKDIANTIHGSTGQGGNTDSYVAEPIACAMRGRNPDNPSERAKSNGNYKQRIEMGNDISNTITSVQKDALVAEPQPIIFDDYNQRIPKDQDTIGTITTNIGNPAPRHGYKIIEPCKVDENYPHVREFDNPEEAEALLKGVSVHPTGRKLEFKGEESIRFDDAPCLRASDYKNPHCVWEQVARELKDIASKARGQNIEVTINEEGSLRPHKMDKAKSGCSEFQVENENDTSSTLISARPNMTYGATTSYRIRKLTERECFRLMGVADNDINKIQTSGVSRSQQYKMAGNSIVVDVLFHIFRKLYIETQCEHQQLTLF